MTEIYHDNEGPVSLSPTAGRSHADGGTGPADPTPPVGRPTSDDSRVVTDEPRYSYIREGETGRLTTGKMPAPTLSEISHVVGEWCGWPPGALIWKYEMLAWHDPEVTAFDGVEHNLDACRKFESVLGRRGLGDEYIHQLRNLLYGAGFREIPPGDGLRIRMATPEQLLRAAYRVIMEAKDA